MADAGMVAGETVEFLIFGDYMACEIFDASPRSEGVAYLCRPDDYLSSIVAKLEYAVAQNRPQQVVVFAGNQDAIMGMQAKEYELHISLIVQTIQTLGTSVIASAVERSAAKPPDQIIRTTGSDWEAMTEKLRKQSGADFTMVTEPKRPNQKPAPQPEEPVNLNVYNVKAYPKEFQQIGIAQDAVMASANWRIGKTKTKSWYVGVWGMAELKQPERSKIGVVLTRM